MRLLWLNNTLLTKHMRLLWLHVRGIGDCVCAVSAEVVDAYFTEPTDWNPMLKAADVEQWLAAVKLEFGTLVKTGCWEVVDIPLCPRASLLAAN